MQHARISEFPSFDLSLSGRLVSAAIVAAGLTTENQPTTLLEKFIPSSCRMLTSLLTPNYWYHNLDKLSSVCSYRRKGLPQ